MCSIFISWSGSLGKLIANYLRDHLLRYSDLKPWCSDKDIISGSVWFEETRVALESAKYSIVCSTPGSSRKPWVNFESGFLFGRLGNCKLITFGETIDYPLKQLQRRDGTKKDTWVELLHEMSGRKMEECEAWVDSRFDGLKKIIDLREASPYKYIAELNTLFSEVHSNLKELQIDPRIRENVLLQQVITTSYSDLKSMFEAGNYQVPASKYPHYLSALQENLGPVVTAIALVNMEEQFWQQPSGKKILETIHRKSIRVFIFYSEKHFMQMADTLRSHALKYRVYAMSYKKLSRDFPSEYNQDFSIMRLPETEILAYYGNFKGQRTINFTSNARKLSDYKKELDSIISRAVFVHSSRKQFETNELENLKSRIFSQNLLRAYPTKSIEMSGYIDIDEYDRHEEKHAYYIEMMGRMLSHSILKSEKGFKSHEVLEFGAGTGIFTKRLRNSAQVRRVVAIELDWHCYKFLEKRFKDTKKVETIEEDSRFYDPDGAFNYVFSSFSDHHIDFPDKSHYFSNVKKNLKPGGLFIVGDEFLPEHDVDDETARAEALQRYHGHIIDIAVTQGENELARLERQALDSGLRGLGDFKVSCSHYERYLKEAGFIFKREKIGPLDTDELGGVYVYIAWLED